MDIRTAQARISAWFYEPEGYVPIWSLSIGFAGIYMKVPQNLYKESYFDIRFETQHKHSLYIPLTLECYLGAYTDE